MANSVQCAIWKINCEARNINPNSDGRGCFCSRAGGEYYISGSAEAVLRNKNDNFKRHLTTYIVDSHRNGICPEITTDTLESIIENTPPITQRRERLLEYFNTQTNFVGDDVEIHFGLDAAQQIWHPDRIPSSVPQRIDPLLAWSSSLLREEVEFLLRSLIDEGLLIFARDETFNLHFYSLSVKGHAYFEKNKQSNQAFVAMWFNKNMNDAYTNGIAPAIKDAGFEPMRIDNKEHTNKICDEIVAEIRSSRFLVADFTSETDKPRGGVYFEAGFALGLGIPVIWTCHEDLIGQVHFDTRQYNHIVWSSSDNLRKKLHDRIRAVIV
jgi:hypothetical protein